MNEMRRNELFQSMNTRVSIHFADTFMRVSDTQVQVDIEGDTCIHTWTQRSTIIFDAVTQFESGKGLHCQSGERVMDGAGNCVGSSA